MAVAENLPRGVTLTIRPLTQIVPAKSSAVFHCTLSFLTEIIDAPPAVKGCHVDPTFSLTTFRKTDHSAERWNGVEITARPRKMTTHKFTYAAWDYSPKISLRGQVTPNPGGGKVEIRFAYTDTDGPLFWVTVALDTNGEWSWEDFPVGGMDGVGVSALYEGNMVYGSSGTDEVALKRESLK